MAEARIHPETSQLAPGESQPRVYVRASQPATAGEGKFFSNTWDGEPGREVVITYQECAPHHHQVVFMRLVGQFSNSILEEARGIWIYQRSNCNVVKMKLQFYAQC